MLPRYSLEFRAVNSFRLTVFLYTADNAPGRGSCSPEPSSLSERKTQIKVN